jgi:hypothetical protein
MSNRKEGIHFVNVDNLQLDTLNPRLYGESSGETQEEIKARIYDKEDIDELASSLAVNGYFEEEPIIIVPENPADFSKITKSNINDFKYIVVEGNRRTTSVKLLLDKNNKIVDDDFPKILEPSIEEGLKKIPAIIYENKEDVDIYLSIRHITGNRKWDAYAKAKYIYEKVNKISTERTISKTDAVNVLTAQIGDNKDVIRKNYIYYKVFLAIENDVIEYKSTEIKKRFSLIEVCLAAGNTTVSKYIGVPPFSSISIEDDSIIKPEKVDKLENITQWIFGKDENGTGSLISDSRNINSQLKKILGKDEATEYLEKYGDIEGAMALTDGKDQLIIGNVRKAKVLLSKILDDVSDYRTNDAFITALEELKSTISKIDILIKE